MIDGSCLAPDSPLEKAHTELTAFYATTFSRKAIMDKVEQIDKEYRNILGDQPVFWYLLAVGVEISNPRSNGRAGNDYYTTARQLGPEYYHAYCTYLHAELTRRHEANPTQMVPELCSQYWTPLLRVERELQKLERQPTLVR